MILVKIGMDGRCEALQATEERIMEAAAVKAAQEGFEVIGYAKGEQRIFDEEGRVIRGPITPTLQDALAALAKGSYRFFIFNSEEDARKWANNYQGPQAMGIKSIFGQTRSGPIPSL